MSVQGLFGNAISGLGYAASGVAGHPIQLAPGGLGAQISGQPAHSPQYGPAYNQPYGPPIPYTNPQLTALSQNLSKAPTTQSPSTSNPIQTNNGSPSNNGNNGNNGYQQIQQGQDAGNAQIEADYNNAMSMLDSAQGGLQGQANQASGVIDTQASGAKNDIANTQATAQQGVNSTLQTAQSGANSQMQQARDLFRQTQQQNNAQLSALGISSSSVTSALAEKLGVETARRIAGISGSLADIQTNAQQELGRINTYYSGQIDNITKQANDQKAAIQNSLIQGINQINASRSQAASDKAAARSNLIQQSQSAIASLTAQQQQFQQSLNQWAQQKAAALQPIAQDPNYVQNILAQTQNINSQYAPSGFVATPSFNVNAQGNYTGQINMQKQPVDQFGNPITANNPNQNTNTSSLGSPF